MKVSIYTLTHKDFIPPKNSIYIPLRVGAKEKDTFGYIGDDSGDNISLKNDTFSELTGCYWVWKNDVSSDIVGVCHYRRYLLGESGGLLKGDEIEGLLEEYDLITTKALKLNFSYEYGFGKNHKPYYLNELDKVIKAIYPDYYDIYRSLIESNHTYFGNMMICKKSLYDEYMTWLFDILFAMDKTIIIDEEDSYHRRIYGFISEFLLYVYCRYNHLRVYETMVGMVGEKAEVTEIKSVLSRFLETGDYMGAKKYFLEEYKKRPDILMEASDINNELHLSMEIISIAEHEADTLVSNPIINRGLSFDELIGLCRRLNAFVIKRIGGCPDKNEEAWTKENEISKEAIFVAEAMYRSPVEKV